MEERWIPKENPKRRRNTRRAQLRWRDKYTAQEVGTDHAWPNP
jgi:hypothetical protein